MTRRTVFRLLVATRLLLAGNFTAYWWLMPRKMKRFRTVWDVMMYRVTQIGMARMAQEWQRSFEVAAMIKRGEVGTISRGEFRLPFQVTP